MAKDREARKKEKKEEKEKKEKKEKKERKRREAEELEAREKKLSKKRKSEKPEKSEKSKKKSKKSEVEVEEKPHKKSKESKKKRQRSDESEDEPETETVRSGDSHPVTVPIVTTTINNVSDSDFEFDKEDIKNLLESYSKEELVNLIYKTAEKGSRLISAVLESADRDTAQRNIFVRGLGWDTTHENLKAAFEVYGEIEECSVVMDKDTGRAKGYGFVLFKTRKGAREALRNPEKRMYNRTVSCNLSQPQAKPSAAGKPREQVESVKIDLTHTANQSEVALPGLDLAHGHAPGFDKGHQQQNMPMYAGQNMPFYGHAQPPAYNPMYGALMGNQSALMANQMVAGLPNYRMYGPGMMMNQGPPNHMGMTGPYNGDLNGVGPGFDGERAWYLR